MKIAITTNDLYPDQSTFINAQRDLIGFDKIFLYGGLLPLFEYDYGCIATQTFFGRVIGKLTKEDFRKKSLVKFLKKNDVRLILAQYGVSAASLVDICIDNNIKLIPHFHGFDAYEHRILEQFKEQYRKVFAYSSSIIAVSMAMKRQLVKLGAVEEKIVYNPCAPNDEFFTVKVDYESNRILSIGRFVDKKAPYLTLLAFYEAKKQIPNLELVMIGDGPLMNTVVNLIKYLKLESSVFLRGHLEKEDIIKEMNRSFCYVQHSLTSINGDSEGTPVAIMEAGAAGLPIVSTYHAGIPEVAIDGKAALLVQEHDVHGMAEKIIQLSKDREMSRKMGESGREHTRKNFSMNKYISTLNICIDRALQK